MILVILWKFPFLLYGLFLITSNSYQIVTILLYHLFLITSDC
jgi:hypothetical protein